ncbi:MAG: M48 family metalloprotease [Pseudomonadota bacterium]
MMRLHVRCLLRVASKGFEKVFTRSFIWSVLVLGLYLSGCTTNPATGESEFTPLMSPAQEKEAGAQSHRGLVNSFGGEYDNPKLRAYIEKVTQRITTVTEYPSDYYQITILDSPIVNAFALPGGYLYVTRGLVALANTEAELAGVIGHEAGHVTARHAANRMNIYGLSQIASTAAAILTGTQAAGQAVGLAGQGVIASYSRSDEYEADMLGVRYLAKAGYNPFAQADFLNNLEIYSRYRERTSNRAGSSLPSFFATHPATDKRVLEAAAIAEQKSIKGGDNNRMPYLQAINGMIWGDNPKQGIIEGNDFIHPDLRFKFTVPDSFTIENQPTKVAAYDQSGAILIFDMDSRATSRNMLDYMKYEFAGGAALTDIRKISLPNVRETARATARMTINNRNMPATLYALRGKDNKVYRFIAAAPQNIRQNYTSSFEKSVRSFRNISSSEAKSVKSYIIAYRKIRPGDSFASLARRMAIQKDAEALFRALNGFRDNDRLPTSGYVKLILRK